MNKNKLNQFSDWLSEECNQLPKHLSESIITNLSNLIDSTESSTSYTNIKPINNSVSTLITNLITNIQDIIKFSLNVEKSVTVEDSDQCKVESYERTIDDLESTIHSLKQDLEKQKLDYDIIKEEYEELQNASHEMQTSVVSEFASLRAQRIESERKIRELNEELELAHRVRHDSTIALLVSDSDLKVALQSKTLADNRALEYENKFHEINGKYETLLLTNRVIENDRVALTDEKRQLEAKVIGLEEELRGLDQAEAAMTHAIQNKHLAENRSSRLETEMQTLLKNKQQSDKQVSSLQEENGKLKSDISILRDKIDYFSREKIVLEAEIKAYSIEMSTMKKEMTKFNQSIMELSRANENKSHEIEILLKERQETEEFIRILRQQIEELQYRKNYEEDDDDDDGDGKRNSNGRSIQPSARELRDLLAESEDKVRFYEQELQDLSQIRLELYDEISRMQSEIDVLTQMNHNLQVRIRDVE